MTVSSNRWTSRVARIRPPVVRIKSDPVKDYESITGVEPYAVKQLTDLSTEVEDLHSLYDRPVKKIVENHSSVLQSRMQYRRNRIKHKTPRERLYDLLLQTHTDVCALILESLNLNKSVEMETSTSVITVLKEEKKVNQYPPGTIFDNGVPYFPAIDEWNRPINNNFGVQLYTDGSGQLFEPPQQQPQVNNNHYQQNHHNPGQVRTGNRSYVTPNNQVHRQPQPSQTGAVIDNWSSGSVLAESHEYHNPAPVTTRVTVENNRPKVTTTQRGGAAVIVETDARWTGNEQQPYPLAFNPFTQVIISVMKGEDVLHDIKPLTKPMDIKNMSGTDWSYLEHELDPTQRLRYKDETALAAKRAKRLNAPFEYMYEPVGLADLKARTDIDLTKPLVANSIMLDDINVTSIEDGINGIYNALISNGVSIDNIAGAVCHISTAVPLTAEEQLFDLNRLRHAKTLSKLAFELKGMFGLDNVPSPLWLTVDRFLTKIVNDFLKYQMGLSVHIESFAEDGGELMNYLLTSKGNKVYDIAAIYEEELIAVFQDWFKLAVDANDKENPAMASLTRHQLTLVSNYSVLEFNLAVDPNLGYGILNPQQHGALIAALEPMFSPTYVTDDIMVVFAGGVRGYFKRSAIIKGCVIFVLE